MTANRIRLVLVVAFIAGMIYAGMGAAKFGESIKSKADARSDAAARYLQ